jgi:hypothetical protein
MDYLDNPERRSEQLPSDDASANNNGFGAASTAGPFRAIHRPGDQPTAEHSDATEHRLVIFKQLAVVVGTDGVFACNPNDQASFLKRFACGHLPRP